MHNNSQTRVQQKFAMGEKRLQALLQNSAEGVALLDTNAKTLFVSVGFERIAGYLLAESVGLQLFQLIHPDDADAVKAKVQQCFEQPTVPIPLIVYRFKHKQGHWIWLSATFTDFSQDADVGGVVMNFRDITRERELNNKQQMLVKQLEERNAFIETILQNLPIGIAVNKIDDGTATVINKSFSRIYGWDDDDFKDIPSFLEKVYPDEAYRHKMTEMIMADINSGDPQRMSWNNVMITTREGQQRIINAKNIPLYDQNLMISTVIDVTHEAKQAAEIQRTKANQEALINGTKDLVWSIDVNYRIITCNRAFRETVLIISGKQVNTDDGILLDEFGAEFVQRWQEYYERSLKGEAFSIKEHISYPATNELVYGHISFTPMHNAGGEIFGVACYCKDITKDTINMVALQEIKREYNKIMDSSVDMICAVSADGHFLKVSAACQSILGYTPEELIGQKMMDYVHPDDRQKTTGIAEKVMGGMSMTNVENRYIHKNGTAVPLVWSAKWDPDDQVRYGIARDATEMKRNENLLVESEKKYKYLFQNNPMPILIWDLKTYRIIDCNDEAQIMYGYTREEFLDLDISRIHAPEDIPLFKSATESEESYGQIHKRVWRRLKKNGELMYVNVTGHLIDYNGRRVSISLSNNITQSWYYNELDKLERNILELNARRVNTLNEVLTNYLLGIEALHTGMLCSVLELKGKQLFSIASPSISADYLDTIDGFEIGENAGSCGTAAFLKQQIIVTDIAADKRWEDFRSVALKNNLKACWSTPIFDWQGNVMATFACYFHTEKAPSQLEENTLGRAVHILQVIIESYYREQALQISNQRYIYATKATSDAIWDWNLITGSLYWGEGFQTIFGYTIAELKNDITSWTDYLHPDDSGRVIKKIYDTINGTEDNWFDEYRFKNAQGEYVYATDVGFVIRDDQGRAIRMVGAMQDVTRKKREELRLRLLESVVTNTTDGVLITEAEPFDEPGPRILYVNEAFTKMTGYTADELIGKTPRVLQGPKSDMDELKRLSKSLRNWEHCEVTTINYKKSGEEFWINFSVSPVADEKGWYTHWVAIERDVTRQKHEELQRLKLSEAVAEAFKERNTILESIGDAFFAVDENWVVSYWNNMAEKVLLTPKEKILNKHLWDVFSGSVGSVSYKKYHEAIRTSQSVHFEDYHPPVNRWYEISAYPSGTGLSVYFKDITGRKLSELRLKQLNDDLKKQTRELAVSNAELEQFAYIASHDLQEPLRMVTSFLTQLEKKYSPVVDDKGRKYIYFAVDGAKRMRQIILDLLEFSRVGRTEEHMEDIDINMVIDETIQLYRKKITETRAKITFKNLPVIHACKAPLRQVFQNLISNSLKYCKAHEAPAINITCTDEGLYWHFAVHDNGIGISEEYFDKIFIIFKRLHNKDEYSGTGMGLALTKKIVENMGGRIWLESEEGKGSTFYFTILKNILL